MSHRQELADKLGAEHWDDELLAMWTLERIAELEEVIDHILMHGVERERGWDAADTLGIGERPDWLRYR